MSTSIANMSQLAKGLQQSAISAGAESGSFMKFKKGVWTHGSEDQEVEEDSLWAIHPQGFQHGWIGWGDEDTPNDGTKLGEVMISSSEPLPSEDDLPKIEGSWCRQVVMQMICVDGLDKGTKVIFNTGSVGGRKLYTKIVMEVVAKIDAKDEGVAPVVYLDMDSYPHSNKRYGEIFVPLMEIKDWKTVDELTALLAESDDDEAREPEAQIEEKKVEPEPEPKPEPEPEPEGRKRRTRRSR